MLRHRINFNGIFTSAPIITPPQVFKMLQGALAHKSLGLRVKRAQAASLFHNPLILC